MQVGQMEITKFQELSCDSAYEGGQKELGEV